MTELKSASVERAKRGMSSLFPAVSAGVAWLSAARNAAAVFAGSVLILIPVYWHKHVIAGDLSSHVYNAWLANKIADGQIPTLHLRPQYSNVLVDWMMSALLRHMSWIACTRLVSSLVILVFFWGAFAISCAAARRAAWTFTPLLAVFTYGFIFNFGFFNMYLSVGLALWGLAILWTGDRGDFLLPLLLFPWMVLAHPLGAGFFVAFGGYLLVMRGGSSKTQLLSTLAAALLFFAARAYVLTTLAVLPSRNNFRFFAGFDQLILFGKNYQALALIAAGIAAILIALEVKNWREDLGRVLPWLLAYGLLCLVVAGSPEGVLGPGRLGVMGILPGRLSLLAAVFAYCLLSLCRPRLWHTVAFLAVAVAYFSFLFGDTARYDRLATKAEEAVRSFTAPERILQIHCPTFGRIFIEHFFEQACIDHCWVLNNYEILSGQFRIVADPNSPYSKPPELRLVLEAGLYRVEPRDLPLKEIHQCGPDLDKVCVRDLRAGEESGAVFFEEMRRSNIAKQFAANHR